MSNYILYDPEAPVILPRRPKRDCTKIVLTDEQQQWLCDNYATTLNKDCAEHLGVSMSTVNRLARELGLTKDPAWFRAILMDHVRMMAAVNRGPGNQGSRNLLIHGVNTRFRKGTSNRDRNGEENERMRIQRAAATRRETIRKERMRVRWGLPQETKLRVISNRKASEARYALKRRGYIIPGRGAMVAFYNAATTRSTVVEQHAAQIGISVMLLHEGNVPADQQGCIDNVNVTALKQAQ